MYNTTYIFINFRLKLGFKFRGSTIFNHSLNLHRNSDQPISMDPFRDNDFTKISNFTWSVKPRRVSAIKKK